jgi:hypothetical protein
MSQVRKSTSRSRGKQNGRAQLKSQDGTLGLHIVHPRAAGIDVGNEEHWVAINPELDPYPVRSFGCFTRDLEAMADWLVGCGIDTVAMQSTGVYWIALHDILAQRGIGVFVVNAADTKNLPGRKTDVQECQWLLKLHTHGSAEEFISAGGGDCGAAYLLATEAAAYCRCITLYPTHAEGADANECAVGECNQ